VKRIHLLRHDGPAEALGPLIAAAREAGLRVGWLDRVPGEAKAEVEPVPASLGAAAGAGAFRSVSLADGRSVAVKALSGPPVLRDVLREHFLGCALVVLTARGAEAFGSVADELREAPEIETAEGGYRVTPPGEAGRVFAPGALAARLRRPRPWS
jgi:hypothetical protein